MEIEYDEAKRQLVLEKRGLDLADARKVFENMHVELIDDRQDYGEVRLRVWGYLGDRRVSLVWTPRGNRRRIITMRYAHEREHETIFKGLERS